MSIIHRTKKIEYAVRIILLTGISIYILCRILYSIGFFKEQIRCGAEKIVIRKEKHYYGADGYRFDNANYRSSDMAYEGSFSVKLTPENQYGFSITLGTPKTGSEYLASVWVHENKISADTNGYPFLVASIGTQFWQGATEAIETNKVWYKLQLNITVPDGSYEEPLVIYCWNNTKNEVYFDNMIIERNNYFKFFK